MEKYQYICNYCCKEYVPRRRHVQRFCCTSCRVNDYNRRTKTSAPTSEKGLSIPQKGNQIHPGINLAGISNAAIANVAVDFAKHIFTRDENKPATKGDLKALLTETQERYLPVTNAPRRNDGTAAFYDTSIKQVVYLKKIPKWQ